MIAVFLRKNSSIFLLSVKKDDQYNCLNNEQKPV